MDVRDEGAQKEQIAKAVALRGPIQICVANAGMAEGRKLQKTTSEFWRDIMATNLDGAFYTIRECMTSMLQSDWGRVIAISSIAGVRGLKGWCLFRQQTWAYRTYPVLFRRIHGKPHYV